jgi:hypothetical protein
MPVNDQSAAIPYFAVNTYPANTIGAALQAGAVGAPINSPNFTGDPRAPTPSPGDNDTSIATTAFVQAAITTVSVPNGDKGDITVSGTGNIWTIDPQAVTLAKLVNATAQYRLLMRTTAGAGSFEEVQGSADVANFLTATNFSNMRTKLSLGALSTQSLVDNADWDAAGLALAIANGGTGQKTTPLARTALSGTWTTLTDGATIATDCAVNDRFTVTLAGTPRTLANPSNIIDGCDYRWRIIQDATGGRALTLGSAFNFAAGAPAFALPGAANSVSYLSGIGRGSKIDVVATLGFAA